MLYDLAKDPYELENLANDPAAGEIRAGLEKELGAWQERTGDSWNFNWSAPVEDKGRLYRHQALYTVEEYLNWAKEHPELAQ